MKNLILLTICSLCLIVTGCSRNGLGGYTDPFYTPNKIRYCPQVSNNGYVVKYVDCNN